MACAFSSAAVAFVSCCEACVEGLLQQVGLLTGIRSLLLEGAHLLLHHAALLGHLRVLAFEIDDLGVLQVDDALHLCNLVRVLILPEILLLQEGRGGRKEAPREDEIHHDEDLGDGVHAMLPADPPSRG